MCSLCTCPVTPISNWPPVHPAAAPPLRGCRRPYTSSANTARAEAGGIQGGPPPCAGGQEFSELQTRRSLAYLSQHLCCYFPLREKVGRGAGRSARKGFVGTTVPAQIPRGTEAPPFYKNPASKQNTRCGIERTINPPSGSGQSSKKINTLCPR